MATQPKVRAGNALALLRQALESERAKRRAPDGYHSATELAAVVGASECTVRRWLRVIKSRVPLKSVSIVEGCARVQKFLISPDELRQAVELMHGLASIQAINAAAAAKGRTDTATHVRIARNEKIQQDLTRQRKGRTGK